MMTFAALDSPRANFFAAPFDVQIFLVLKLTEHLSGLIRPGDYNAAPASKTFAVQAQVKAIAELKGQHRIM